MSHSRRPRTLRVVAALALAAGLAGGAHAQPGGAPELIVHNARVTTLDSARPAATALAARAGRFVAVGSDAEVLRLRGPATRVVDAGGRRVIPGLTDSHMHPTRGGRLYNLELRWDGVPTLRQALDMVREQAARTPPGEWVRVMGGWSPHQFAEKRMPTLDELNAAAPTTPLLVLHLYSQGMLNRAGMRALGIGADTVPPAGGRFEKGADGQPTGLLVADPSPTLLYQAAAALPNLSAADQVNSTLLFYRELNRLGVTSVVDAGGGGHTFPRDYAPTRALAERGDLPIRISYLLMPQRAGRELQDFQAWMRDHRPGENGDRIRGGGYVLEGGGEILVASASDYENFMSARPELGARFRQELSEVVTLLVRNGWPFRTHATYDESISRFMDVFEDVDRAERAAGRRGFARIRWAIDHAETVGPRNLDRIRALGGGIAIQNRLAFAGEEFAQRYGARAAAAAPPIREMMRRGIPVGAGTDGTRVSSYNPWYSLQWLVTGRTMGGLQLASPENRLTREEALRLWTVGSAWFSGEEAVKGRIAPGHMADFAVLAEDYMTVPEDRIGSLESLLTVVDGRVVHGAEAYAALAPAAPAPSPAWSPVARFGGAYSARRAAPAPLVRTP